MEQQKNGVSYVWNLPFRQVCQKSQYLLWSPFAFKMAFIQLGILAQKELGQ